MLNESLQKILKRLFNKGHTGSKMQEKVKIWSVITKWSSLRPSASVYNIFQRQRGS